MQNHTRRHSGSEDHSNIPDLIESSFSPLIPPGFNRMIQVALITILQTPWQSTTLRSQGAKSYLQRLQSCAIIQ